MKHDSSGYVTWDKVTWLQSVTPAEHYLLYRWPSEGGNIDDEQHLTPEGTERHRLSIQGLNGEIIDWFIRHASTSTRLQDCSQSGESSQSAILLAHLIHWNITHGSAIVQHDWLHCSRGQRWVGRMVICSTHALKKSSESDRCLGLKLNEQIDRTQVYLHSFLLFVFFICIFIMWVWFFLWDFFYI